MGYLLINDFVGGVDRTRPRFALAPGTLYSGINGHITRGGDFEKRKAFVSNLVLPTGATFGLAKTTAGLYTFGSGVTPPGMPAGITYMQLQHPSVSSLNMTELASWDLFNGQLYTIAKYENGDYRHFYNGVAVADWGAGGTKPSGFGTIARTHKRKLYSPIDSILWFSQLDTIAFDTTLSGSGFVNMSNHQSGSDRVKALGGYQDQLGIFSRRVIQLWNMEDDDAENAPAQTIFETGTRAARSVVGFGDLDAFYLSDSGVRSLRARSGTTIAGVNDVGTPIDPLISEWLATLTEEEIERAAGIVEPVDGRYWLAIGGRVFVFSYFPSKKVSAWTWYEPGFSISDFVTIDDRVHARAGDTVYLYGGTSNATYGSDYDVTAELPYLVGGKPGTYKQIRGIDIGAVGAWNVKIYLDPEDDAQYVDIGDVNGNTFIQENIAGLGHSPFLGPKFVHRGEGYASLSQFAIHNDAAESE